MKFFLCAFDALYLGIQAERVERVISVSGTQSSVMETREQEAFVSLPLLFGRADLSAPHGIVLKQRDNERKITLLAPPLDIDIEIPKERIFTVPKALGGNLRYFSGACFIKKDQGERLILVIDLEKLTGDYR